MKLHLDNKPKNIIGGRVKKARKIHNLTQQQLASKLNELDIGMDRIAISRIESFSRVVVDFEIMALSIVLKVSIGWLLSEE